jgi:hypothetical protein
LELLVSRLPNSPQFSDSISSPGLGDVETRLLAQVLGEICAVHLEPDSQIRDLEMVVAGREAALLSPAPPTGSVDALLRSARWLALESIGWQETKRLMAGNSVRVRRCLPAINALINIRFREASQLYCRALLVDQVAPPRSLNKSQSRKTYIVSRNADDHLSVRVEVPGRASYPLPDARMLALLAESEPQPTASDVKFDADCRHSDMDAVTARLSWSILRDVGFEDSQAHALAEVPTDFHPLHQALVQGIGLLSTGGRGLFLDGKRLADWACQCRNFIGPDGILFGELPGVELSDIVKGSSLDIPQP